MRHKPTKGITLVFPHMSTMILWIVDHGLSSIYGTIVCTSLFEWSQISISTILENNFDNGDDQPFIPIPSSHYWESFHFHVGRDKGPCLSIDVCMIYMDPGVMVRDLQKQHNDAETDWMQRERELVKCQSNILKFYHDRCLTQIEPRVSVCGEVHPIGFLYSCMWLPV